MNIAESFANYVEANTAATLGQDLFISNAPSTTKSQSDIWWIVASGGDKIKTYTTGESDKAYTLTVNRRHRDYKQVYDDLHDLEEILNCAGCVELSGFDILEISASVLTIDEDIDSEDRKIGVLQATIITFKEC